MASQNETVDTLTVFLTAVDEINFIDECLNSVRQSTFAGYIEVNVVVSGDNAEIYAALKKYPEVRVLSHDLTGEAGSPRNYGLHHASGQWVAFIDADDLFGIHA